MSIGRLFTWLALVVILVSILAAGFGLIHVLAEPAALTTLILCLVVVAVIVAAGGLGRAPRTAYW